MTDAVILREDDDTSASTHSNNSDDINLHEDHGNDSDGDDFNHDDREDNSNTLTGIGQLSMARASKTTTTNSDNDVQTYSFFGVVPLNSPMWAYGLIALLDVEANYVTVLAFQYTTLTSVNLLDALAIPTAMILSRLFLKRSYVSAHMIGATICMVGIVMNVFTDYESAKEGKEQDEYPHRGAGDFLALLGGVLRGCNNVVQEYAIQNSGMPTEYLGMLGLFGTLLSIIQIAALERDDVAELFGLMNDEGTTCSTEDNVLLVLAYVICLGAVYVGGAYFLLYSEAALYNLSLLTCDLWTVVFSVVAERIIPPPLFFAALLLIVGGVVIYETGPSPIHDDNNGALEDGDSSINGDSDDDEEANASETAKSRNDASGKEGLELVICQAAT